MSTCETPKVQYLNPDPLFSMKEAAEYLGISVSKMYELAERENFPVVKVTSDRKIRKSILDAYIKEREQPWSETSLSKTNQKERK